MENMTLIQKLNYKVEEILRDYEDLKSQNGFLVAESESLRQEIGVLKAQNESKDMLIKKFEEDLAMKDLEIEEIYNKIENFLKR
ncbi:MAG: hypothetical protein HXX81_07330 [Campylobacterales bacterium]|nr:hypothetical protein [Campylobacterales bacterium]